MYVSYMLPSFFWSLRLKTISSWYIPLLGIFIYSTKFYKFSFEISTSHFSLFQFSVPQAHLAFDLFVSGFLYRSLGSFLGHSFIKNAVHFWLCSSLIEMLFLLLSYSIISLQNTFNYLTLGIKICEFEYVTIEITQKED